MKCLVLVIALTAFAPRSFAESRTAKNMQTECRAALDVLQKKVEPTFQNTLFAGECIGYVQGVGDASMTMADVEVVESIKRGTWYKIGTKVFGGSGADCCPSTRQSIFRGGQDRRYSSRLQPPVHQASAHLDDSIHCTDRCRATQAGCRFA